jgi:hypothetical protein
MKTTHQLTIGTVIAAAMAAWIPASADTFIENFDAGPANVGNWTFGVPPTYPATGGNPGKYHRTQGLDTFAPQLRTQSTTSVFTGNYREANVTSVGVDLTTIAVDFSAAGRPLTVILVSNNGTPANVNDDWGAYKIGPTNVPLPGQGWISYDFEIPSQSKTLPEGWNIIKFGAGAPVSPDWNNVITNVSQLRYFYGDPELFFIFQMWTLGVDNTRITTTPPALPGDGNGDGVVDVDDLLMVINGWGECPKVDPCPGDLNASGDVDVDDLLLVINNWTG